MRDFTYYTNAPKGMVMSMKRVFQIVGICVADIAFIALYMQWYIYLTDSYWFLLNENHPIKRFLMIAAISLSIIAVIAVNVIMIRAILRAVERNQNTEPINVSTEKTYTLDELLDIFQNVGGEKPSLSQLMEEAIEQIEIFQEDRTALIKVMEIQNIDYYPITNCMKSTEQKLTRQMKGLLVDISVWNPKRINEEDIKDSYAEVYSSIKQKLVISRGNLTSFHQLLMRVRTFKDEGFEDDSEIRNLIKALEMSKS